MEEETKEKQSVFKDNYHEWISDCRDYNYWGEIDKEVEIVREVNPHK